MSSPIMARWNAFNSLQRRIVGSAGAFLALALLLPPVNVEHRFTGLTDGTNSYALTTREFGGWRFVFSVTLFDDERPEITEESSLYERFQAMRPQSLEEIRRGTTRLAVGVFLLEILVLAALTGGAVYAAGRDSRH